MNRYASWLIARKNRLWLGLSFVIISMLILAACGDTATTDSPTPAPTATATATPVPATVPSDAVVVQMLEQPEGHYFFQPSSITIKAGTVVVWLDSSDAPHTVTSDAGAPTAFNTTSNVTQGKTFALTFNTPGTYNYHCNIHPSMKAIITVTA